ncbi:endonuclease/exonuclease/phosphatase family protein [Micromonospora profundi]|uniref:endonuclease/exonuclease/phosphatase family protein n=1 Tax=Micromonospora profundi TaxID=1420889 RepID=UPI00364F8042
MRYRQLTTGSLALGVILLIDVLRVWLPGIITIFGQAASTPAELMGAFALGWFVLAAAAPALVRRVGARPVTVTAAVVLAAARLALTATPGGRVQLWLATAGLLAGLVWLVGVAGGIDRPVPGLALGLAVNAALHALLDTYDLAWRSDWMAWLLSSVAVGAFLFATAARGAPPGPGGARSWLLAGPVLLLAGMVALAPALAQTAMSYLVADDGVASSPLFGLAPVPVAVAGFLLAALAGPPSRRWGRAVGPVAVLAGAVLFALDNGDLLLAAIPLTAIGLGACLALTDGVGGAGRALTDDASGADPRADAASAVGPAHADAAGGSATPAGVGVGEAGRVAALRAAARRGYAVAAGMLVFVLAAVAYYSAYDLGYPNGAVPVVVAGLIAAVAFTSRPVVGPPAGQRPAGSLAALPTTAVVTALAMLAPVFADKVGVSTNRDGPPKEITVVAYNIRMGFGLDGRFDLPALTAAIDRQQPDVVLLSEVDRGWLLNGGHDTLDLLADRLDMPYVFGAAADAVWGDAVLSRWPIEDERTLRLPAVGAPTGAQALAVTLNFSDGVRCAVVSTHLQPPPGGGPVVQARAVVDFATEYAAGRPLVVGGDLNTEPGDEAFGKFTEAGLVDALAAGRPLATSPADDPRQEIDHVFVSPGLTPSGPVAPPGTASDHLPVAVTLTLPPR